MPRFPGATFILAAALALPTAKGAEVNVYAAASLTDALKEIAVNYEKQSSDKIVFNFGASSLLALQIMSTRRLTFFSRRMRQKWTTCKKRD